MHEIDTMKITANIISLNLKQSSLGLQLMLLLTLPLYITIPNIDLNKTLLLTSNIRIIAHILKHTSGAEVHLKGSSSYKTKQKVHNGLCKNIFPSLIVVPKSTIDVSRIVKVSRYYNEQISIRSGGHSYICSSIKEGGIHIDMRSMNKVHLTNNHSLEISGTVVILGPGSTWSRVLEIVSPEKYTLIHGQCLGVGVGGFLLGGGINGIGTSQRYRSGASNVLQYTMIDAMGDIYKVSEAKIKKFNEEKGDFDTVPPDYGLFRSLQLAGSSYGITTEFVYRVYNTPEVRPVLALVYIEDETDLHNFELAAFDGRYHISIHVPYFFTPINWHSRERDFATAFRIFFKTFHHLQFRERRPILMAVVDNYPLNKQTVTNEEMVYAFLEKYHIKLAIKRGIVAKLLQSPDAFSYLQNYEISYRTWKQMEESGPRPVISANFMNLTSIRSLEDILLRHPLFGLQNLDSNQSLMSGCEYCFLSLLTANKLIDHPDPSRNSTNEPIPIDFGKFQMEMTCLYEPNVSSKCPNVVRNAKHMITTSATRHGERLSQYSNTQSCDRYTSFWERYWSTEVYQLLRKTKRVWDPYNVFNHCHSVGSTVENCCPRDA